MRTRMNHARRAAKGSSRLRVVGLLACVAMLAAACGGGDAAETEQPDESAAGAEEDTTDSADQGSDGNDGDTGETDAAEDEGPAETLRIGVHPAAFDAGFLHMAEEQGFYEKHNVDVEFVELQSASQALPALVAGEVDIIEQSPGALFIASQQGETDVAIVGSSMMGIPYTIYASKEFESLQDLEGASLAVSSPTGLPALVANLILADAGVDLSTIEYVNAGGNADRYRAVVAGTADAASSPADFVPQAEDDGVNVLALSTEALPDYPRYTLLARRAVLDEKPDAVVRYLAGLIEGLRYAFDNPDEAKALAADHMGVDLDDPRVAYMHELIVDGGLVSPNAEIPREKLEFQEQVLLDIGELNEPVDLDAFIEESFLDQALERVGGAR